jgi:hypothetical protein
MKEGVSRIKNGMALERSFSSSGRANDGALAAGEYRIAKELMDTLSTDMGTPRSVRQALEKKAVEVQRRLDSLEVKLPSESRAQAQALAATARVERQEAAEAAASAVKVQAAVRGKQARAAVRAERHRQHAAATRIQARRRANLARAEMRAMSVAGRRVEFDLEHRADHGLTGTDDELDDDIMEMLMSPSITRELAGAPPPPPPPQPYAERLAQLQHRHQELEAEPPILPIDAPVVTTSVTACTRCIRPLLQRAMQAVTCTRTLHDEQTALEYIARCFAAGELLPLEPEAETTIPAVVGQNSGDWSANRTVSAFLGGLEVKVANAMSAGIIEHLQAEEERRKPCDQWERQLAERIGQQLLVLASNSLGGEMPTALSTNLPGSGQALGVETTAAVAAAAVAAEAAQIQAEARRVAVLREELVGLRLSALRKRADAEGADEEMIDEAEDNDDPKQALVSLIVSLASSG